MSLPGVQGHTDTLGGGGLLSKCHSSPWNRKGWFCSNRHGSWRQSPGRLTGGLSLLGTSARDSTTSNSTKGAVESGAAGCQQGHGRGCCSSLLLPFPSPRGLGSTMLSTGPSPGFLSCVWNANYLPGRAGGAVSTRNETVQDQSSPFGGGGHRPR